MTSTQNTPLVLGTESIPKLLFKYAAPAIVGMSAAAIYNLTDSIFIGHGVGALAISGLALTLPLMTIFAAFGSLVGVGAASLLSLKLGQKDYASAKLILGNVLILNTIFGASLGALGLIFLKPILLLFGASEDTLPYAYDYMQIIIAGNIITHIYLGLNETLRASGYPMRAMLATISSVVINCLLVALFIMVFDWGIRGAAFATVIAQAIALGTQIVHFASPKSYLHFEKGILRLKKSIVRGIVSIGLSPFLMNICASGVIILINHSLQAHGGDLEIGAYGIVNRVVTIFVIFAIGLNQGMQPIVGYNYGARQYDRVIKALKITIFFATGITSLTFLACQIIPEPLARMFTSDPVLIEKARIALRVVTIAFPLVGFQIVTGSFFQSIGKPKKSIFLSLTRQLIFLTPLLLLLPPFLGTLGVWLSMPVADGIAVMLAAILLTRQIRQFRREQASNIPNLLHP